MTTTTIEHGGPLEPEGDGHGAVEGGGHHETRAQRHLKERIALWLLVGGDRSSCCSSSSPGSTCAP